MQVQEPCDHVIPANKKKGEQKHTCSARNVSNKSNKNPTEIFNQTKTLLGYYSDLYVSDISFYILPLSMFLHPLQSHCSFQNTPTSMLTTYKTASGLTTKKTFLLHSLLFTQAVIFPQKNTTEMLSNKPSSYSNTFHPNHFQYTLQSYLNQLTQRLWLRLTG